MKYSALRNKFRDNTALLEVSFKSGNRIEITSGLELYVNHTYVGKFGTLKACREAAQDFINKDKVVQESLVSYYIKKNLDVKKITSNLVNEYKNLMESNTFILDPVISEYRSSKLNINNKIEYKLNDGNSVSFTEETLAIFNERLKDKHEIVSYMRESLNNFMRIAREL